MSQTPAVSIEAQTEVVCAVVHHGALDSTICDQVQREVLAAAAEHPTLPLLLDLTAVKYVPSAGLGALVMLNRKLKDQAQRLVLIGVQPDVQAVLEMTRLDKLLEMRADRAAALDHLQGAS